MNDRRTGSRAVRPFLLLTLLISTIALLATHFLIPVAAHGELEAARSNPAPGSIQGTPPERVELWFSEPLAPGGSTIEVFDEQRERVDAGDAMVDASEPTHMTVSLQPVVDGTYTVAWQTLSAADGHTISGTFTFRVGQSRLPGGAATTEGERPAAVAVGLRWLTLIGLSLVAGWFLLGLLGIQISAVNRRLAFGAGLTALLADVALVPAQSYAPGTSEPSQSLRHALSVMPDSWLARLVLEVLALGLIVVVLRKRTGKARSAPLLGSLLVGLSAFTLALTSHSAARESYQAVAILVNALHLGSAVFWLGGLAHFAVAPGIRGKEADYLRRFSRLALVLAPVALLTGVVNAGLLLPALESVWQSDYGRLLIAKTVIAVVILFFAWQNRSLLRAGLQRISQLARSLRTETAFGAAILLVASTLALSATPAPPDNRPLHLSTDVTDNRFAHLVIDEPDAGRRNISIWLSDDDDQPLPQVRFAEASISMLERSIDLTGISPERQSDGRWVIKNVPLTVKGWWQADLRFAGDGIPETRASFVFLLPDPTFAQAERDRPSNPEAEQWFQRAFDNMLQLESVRTTEVLADGIGNSVRTDYQFSAPDRLTYSTSSGNDSIAIGMDQYYRRQNGGWIQRERTRSVDFPGAYESYYSGAGGFTLGRQVEFDGQSTQIISFYVPDAPRREESWYSWWINIDTGLVMHEGMVGQFHYMNNLFYDYNAPMEIERPPVDE